MYGEKYRILFDTVGEEIIELGIKNGREYFNEYALREINDSNLWMNFKWFKPNEKFSTQDELKNLIRSELKPFLSEDEIENCLLEKSYKSFSESNFASQFPAFQLFVVKMDFQHQNKLVKD